VARISLDIDSLGRLGEGVAQGPSGPVFVPFALPGEKIAANVDGDRGTLIALQHVSPERVSPPCPYFGRCGGCSLQHFNRRPYEDWKRSLIVSPLMKHGLSATVRPLVAGHGAGRRRVIFHVRLGDMGKPEIGFMAARSHRLVGIDACLVLAPQMHAALTAGSALADIFIAGTEAFDLQFTAVSGGLDCDVRGISRTFELPLAALADIARKHDLCRLSINGQPAIILAEPIIDCAGAQLVPPPGAFLQATEAGEQALANFVLEHLGKARRAADLFCGVGTFALRLARQLPVLAVDYNQAALGALMQACRGTQGLKPVTAIVRNLFREPLNPDELKDFDVVVFDPPRRGAEAQAKQLAASRCKRVIGISCDPMTFARDAAILASGGYELIEVLPVDQFQWSPHLEIAGLFTRGSKPR
jgi:23S rRNA (uracil1939-C5)-methyltransferase